MAKAKDVPKTLKFEEALDKLEKIVSKMESGDLSLDQSISLFEEGTQLRKFCEKKLAETEQRVETIIKGKASSQPEKLPTEEFNEHDITGMKNEDIPF